MHLQNRIQRQIFRLKHQKNRRRSDFILCMANFSRQVLTWQVLSAWSKYILFSAAMLDDTNALRWRKTTWTISISPCGLCGKKWGFQWNFVHGQKMYSSHVTCYNTATFWKTIKVLKIKIPYFYYDTMHSNSVLRVIISYRDHVIS